MNLKFKEISIIDTGDAPYLGGDTEIKPLVPGQKVVKTTCSSEDILNYQDVVAGTKQEAQYITVYGYKYKVIAVYSIQNVNKIIYVMPARHNSTVSEIELHT